VPGTRSQERTIDCRGPIRTEYTIFEHTVSQRTCSLRRVSLIFSMMGAMKVCWCWCSSFCTLRATDLRITGTDKGKLRVARVLRYDSFLESRIVVPELRRVYPQNLMRLRLLVSVLVVLLSGADSGAALICTAFCASSAPVGSAGFHHHQMEPNPGTTNASPHPHHHGVSCAECPPKSSNSLNSNSDCNNLAGIQALTENSFSLNTPSAVAQGLATSTTDDPALSRSRSQSVVFGTSPPIKSSNPSSLPLRI